MAEFIPCDNCKSSSTPGYIFKDNSTIECDCLKQFNSYISVVKYLKAAEVPEKYIDYLISSYYGDKSAEAIESIKKILLDLGSFVKSGFQLYIAGDIQTQKTSVACYIAKNAVYRGLSVFYITMPSLIHLLKTMDFSKDFLEKDTLKSKVNRIKNVDLLIIDDAFDERKVYLSSKSAYYLTFLEDFFRYRLDNSRSQIYVSNKKRNDIHTKFGKTLITLLNKDCLEIYLEDTLPEKVMNERLIEFLRKNKWK